VARLRGELGDSGVVYEGSFRRTGARVWRGQGQGILAST